MILLIDAGNTRIKWAALNASDAAPAPLGHWQTSGSAPHDQIAALEDAWRSLRPTRAIVANVAGPAVAAALQQAVERGGGVPPADITWFASQEQAGGVRNGYRQARQLGCDRFASAIGAHALFPDTALIVATCGTATTIDAITADGVFTGGMILPGLRLMANSLARNTAQLPEVIQQSEQLPPFADNTEEAIIAGCIAAQAGAIERSVAAYARLHADELVRLLVSGGAAAALLPHLAIAATHVDNLVLIGLQKFAGLDQHR
ncbi:MAG: type III pantothenate kinase [Burkholderiaceae bacterium]|nr:type III pantothenate kinase [Burkholderiaceae bacterium]